MLSVLHRGYSSLEKILNGQFSFLTEKHSSMLKIQQNVQRWTGLVVTVVSAAHEAHVYYMCILSCTTNFILSINFWEKMILSFFIDP